MEDQCDVWDQNGTTNGPTSWQLHDDDDDDDDDVLPTLLTYSMEQGPSWEAS